MTKYDHPWFGLEFAWLAVDMLDHVGCFDSEGYGPVPAVAMERATDLDGVRDRIRRTMPVICLYETEPLPGDLTDWRELASRGIYAFDWKNWHGPYRRVTAPIAPLAANGLPSGIRELARLVVLPVDLAAVSQFQLQDLDIPIAMQTGDS